MSDPQLLQGTTVSALTTDSDTVYFLVDSGGGEETTLLPVKSIFHCPFIEESTNSQNGKMSWLCKWCGKKFSPRHQSQAIHHVLKTKLGDIAISTVSIPKEYEDRYCALYVRSMERMQSKKRSHAEIDDALAINQTLPVANLLQKCGVAISGGTTDSSPPTSIHSLPSVQSSLAANGGSGASHSSISLYTRGSKTSTPFALSSQSFISVSIQNMDICKSHNAIVEMSITDFFHCENIPDAVVELQRFKRLVKGCRLVGEDFVVPNCKNVGGDLLDINYENIYSLNKAELIKEATVFGSAWMGDGATIHKMPLMNILATNGTTAPMTVLIHNCTKHMEEGGKKDAPYIAELFEAKVMDYNPQQLCTDVFYFDGASNVQKAGEVLMAKFPQIFFVSMVVNMLCCSSSCPLPK
jgi:hypothetical protein